MLKRGEINPSGDQAVAQPGPPRDALARGENAVLAARLRDYADLLEAIAASPFRAQAYRRGAEVIENLRRPVSAILAEEGQEGLDALPGIGPRIASALSQLSTTGRWTQLERMRAELEPEALFRTIPGIGPVLANRLAEDLHLTSLEALESAAHDGRLAEAAGWGPRRVRMVQTALAERLGWPRFRSAARRGGPPVAVLLDADREYREGAAAGRLSLISPRRMNPGGEAWLPILRTQRGDWRLTALFSNTPLAHKLGRTHDWVVIYYDSDGAPDGQCTVVTETRGPRKGLRVVRGREAEIA